MKRIKKVFISACELSADKYAAELAIQWKKINPDIQIVGIGSDASRQAGIDVKWDMSMYSTVGLIEPLRFAPQLIYSFFKLKHFLKEEKPDVFIPIDNQGFHMKCCSLAKELGVPTAYFVAPQHWHWGTISQGKKVAEVVDHVLAIFPQEKTFYERCGAKVKFVGHPCIDRIKKMPSVNSSLNQTSNLLGVFPGSRKQEIERLLPVYLKALPGLCKEHKLRPIVSVAANYYSDLINTIIDKHEHLFDQRPQTYSGNMLEFIATLRVSIVSSGTISLEHALMRLPHVVAYKFNPLTYWIAQTFFKKTLAKIPFMSMPNIILNKAAFPELLQDAAKPNSISAALQQTLAESKQQQLDAQTVYDMLDTSNTARLVVDYLEQSI